MLEISPNSKIASNYEIINPRIFYLVGRLLAALLYRDNNSNHYPCTKILKSRAFLENSASLSLFPPLSLEDLPN